MKRVFTLADDLIRDWAESMHDRPYNTMWKIAWLPILAPVLLICYLAICSINLILNGEWELL